MTPANLNAAMPLGEPMSTQNIARALEAIMGRPPHLGQLVNLLRQHAPHIEAGQYTTRWRQWIRRSDIPEPVAVKPNYPCPVRHEVREIPLTTKSTGTQTVRITLPAEPWVTA